MRLPIPLFVMVVASWVAWITAFLSRKRSKAAQEIDPRARWGIALQGFGFALIWQGHFWERAPGWPLAAMSAVLLTMAILLAWTGVRVLGRHWRLDAGLNPDHELVRRGPYKRVRHPIYASMLCLLLGAGLILSPWPLLAGAISVFVIGTEIRVRVEERLLREKFGQVFDSYRRETAAYIPGVR